MTPGIVDRFYADLSDQGTGLRTLQKVHSVLHSALGSAVRLGLLERNPAALGREVPKYRAPEREPLTATQARKLLAEARKDNFYALYLLALVTGARQGELFALAWSDVDFAKGVVFYRRSLQDGKNAKGKRAAVRGETKTKASRRRIEIPEEAVVALMTHRSRLEHAGIDVSDDAFVFPNERGGPLNRQNFLRREYYPLLERAKLPKIHFHDLRNTAATLAAAAGKPVVAVAALLCHADPTITLRVYQHAFEGAAGNTASAIGSVLLNESVSRKKRKI